MADMKTELIVVSIATGGAVLAAIINAVAVWKSKGSTSDSKIISESLKSASELLNSQFNSLNSRHEQALKIIAQRERGRR